MPTPKTAVLLCNLGTPDAPTPAALRRYLGEFLSDQRVVEIPRLLWWPILHGIILRVRPAKSAKKYASIWMRDGDKSGSPLRVWTERQAVALNAQLQASSPDVTVRYAMRYGSPSIAQQLDALQAEGVQRILILPAYPQYSGTTTASVVDAVAQWTGKIRSLPELRFVNRYHDDPGYISALAARIKAHWQTHGRPDGTTGKLVLSFHGLPERNRTLGDPYYDECQQTASLLAQSLQLNAEQYLVTFQSRFGAAKWLQPYTEPTVMALARSGVQRVDVACPGFTSDCIETLEEIDQEVREAFLTSGGQEFRYIPCLNDEVEWVKALGQIGQKHLSGWL
ncbi:ferrochelatase [Hylemonella gracilis str. Niagara R]|uniref:Ferrochelatase n=1 Tax=Hylemonella gracilis str. Niagara R TaxID=1458275 RepID=A0A016XHA9_9BURK|nr:ferrochelatase [Hylemonella gracilis]EYC50947.1 ferrochelatase [Hylemonella gracilis str. Niagara R]